MTDDPLGAYFGETHNFDCIVEEGDRLEVRRVGLKSNPKAAIAITGLVAVPDFPESDEDFDTLTAASVVLDPRSARRLVAVLLDLIDEVTGDFTELLNGTDEGDLDA